MIDGVIWLKYEAFYSQCKQLGVTKLIDDNVKNEMNELLNKMSKKFEDDNFYYTMSVLYYIAKKQKQI